MDVQETVANFFSAFPQRTYKKGEILIRADDDPSGIFYMIEGIVKEYAISQKGDEIVVNLFKKESFFPMSWAMNKTPNKYFFEAMTVVHAQKAPEEKVLDFVKKNPAVLYDLLCRVYRGTDGILTRMLYLMSGDAYKRIIIELLIHEKRFGVHQHDTKNTSMLRMSEKDLATQSGMSRETVSREIKKLKEKGLVTYEKKILLIPDVRKLKEEFE